MKTCRFGEVAPELVSGLVKEIGSVHHGLSSISKLFCSRVGLEEFSVVFDHPIQLGLLVLL